MGHIRVLCIDDQPEIRRMFEIILGGHDNLQPLGFLDTTEDLESRPEQLKPDVVVLDASMPGLFPLSAMRDARARFPSTYFLVSSSHDDPIVIRNAFNSGATGYLTKEHAFGALADAVRKVARGERVTP